MKVENWTRLFNLPNHLRRCRIRYSGPVYGRLFALCRSSKISTRSDCKRVCLHLSWGDWKVYQMEVEEFNARVKVLCAIGNYQRAAHYKVGSMRRSMNKHVELMRILSHRRKKRFHQRASILDEPLELSMLKTRESCRLISFSFQNQLHA